MTISTDNLRDAMHANFGSVLTPELAAQIEFAAHDRADRAHSPSLFMPRPYRNLVFRVESFRAILPELKGLHEAHFEETEKHLAGFELNPDYDYMGERERMGSLVQFTARDGQKLAGNLRMYLAKSLHTGHLVADEDTFYLLPEYRKGFAAMSFLRYAEDMLTGVLGVAEIRANTKIVNAASKLMGYRGYRHVANQYIKTFTKD
jgi:hypothetical protein